MSSSCFPTSSEGSPAAHSAASSRYPASRSPAAAQEALQVQEQVQIQMQTQVLDHRYMTNNSATRLRT
jgi:hypothetical protein